MALDVDATPGGVDANAYADADDDVTPRAQYRAPTFLALTKDQQAQAIVSAQIELSTLESYAIGERSTTTQALPWPRDGQALPKNLIAANSELAFSFAAAIRAGSDPLAPDNPAARGIKREKVGPLEQEYFGPTIAPDGTIFYGPGLTTGGDPSPLSRFPAIVQRLMAPLLNLGGADVVSNDVWGTGTAVRSS